MRWGRGGSLCGWCPEAWSPLSLWAPGADLPRPYLRQAFLAKPRDVAQQHSPELRGALAKDIRILGLEITERETILVALDDPPEELAGRAGLGR